MVTERSSGDALMAFGTLNFGKFMGQRNKRRARVWACCPCSLMRSSCVRSKGHTACSAGTSRHLARPASIQPPGVRVVFDDFGTGCASPSYLKKFPLDGLKIDRSFLLDLLSHPDDAAIVGSTLGLSRQSGLSVVAEGIENRATADLLLMMGYEEGQGYFRGLSMPALSFESEYLARKPAAAGGDAGRAA
jgi:predicted signal transduction protein with EAL and GGDEF domain